MKIQSHEWEGEHDSSSQGDPPRKRGKKRPRDEGASSSGYFLRRRAPVLIIRGELAWSELSELLDDTPIELGLRMWLNDLWIQNPALVNQVHIFGSRFYTNMDTGRGKPCHYERVRRWTSKVDLFSKKFIIVPVIERLCQYLAIICFPEYALEPPLSQAQAESAPSAVTKKTWILILDLYGGERPRVIRLVREYLQAEAKTRYEKVLDLRRTLHSSSGRVADKHLLVWAISLMTCTIPTEQDDRGIYLLHCLEMFLTNPLGIISLSPAVKPKPKDVGRRYEELWKMDQVKDKRAIFREKLLYGTSLSSRVLINS
ncbi:hypothetical protein B0J17DRAFT_707124 [Rhizoctonia solani]|nr:hypothetical protein B0J17DRAFT_707124 [Rhizoctonia solani]